MGWWQSPSLASVGIAGTAIVAGYALGYATASYGGWPRLLQAFPGVQSLLRSSPSAERPAEAVAEPDEEPEIPEEYRDPITL